MGLRDRLKRAKARVMSAVSPDTGMGIHMVVGFIAAQHPTITTSVTLCFLAYQLLDWKAGEDPRVTQSDIMQYVAGLLAGVGASAVGIKLG